MMLAERGSLLSCQRNSYLRESVNQILSCEKISTTKDSNDLYRVILDDSALYPEGGGQPCDLGTVDGVEVLKVTKAEGVAGVALELPRAPSVAVGGQVKCVVDWKRRFDFMQQHTAQHLISAVAFKLFGAETVGWSLGEEVVTVDLVPPSPSPVLTTSQLTFLEDEVNSHIRQNRRVSYEILTKDELELEDSLRGSVKGAAMQLAELRVVVIEGLDKNPCGGTHVNSLGELNLLKIVAFEKDRQATRVRFLAGNRALQHYSDCVVRETALSSLLSASPKEFVSVLDKVLKDRREASKKLDGYAEELAGFWGKSLVESLPAGPAVVVQYRESADLKFLLKAATKALETKTDVLIFLASHEEGTAGPFVLFGDAAIVNKCKPELFSVLSARGGGKPGRVQGYAQSLKKDLQGVQKVLEESL